jgi:hypothetical protein
VKKPAAPPDLWDRLDKIEAAAFGGETEGVPPGAFTMAEYCKERGLSVTTAQSRIARLVALGRLHKGRSRRLTVGGKSILLNVYWVP